MALGVIGSRTSSRDPLPTRWCAIAQLSRGLILGPVGYVSELVASQAAVAAVRNFGAERRKMVWLMVGLSGFYNL